MLPLGRLTLELSGARQRVRLERDVRAHPPTPPCLQEHHALTVWGIDSPSDTLLAVEFEGGAALAAVPRRWSHQDGEAQLADWQHPQSHLPAGQALPQGRGQ